MAFTKGHKKQGGRQKGTENKTTATLKAGLESFINEDMEQFQIEVRKLQGKDYVHFYLKVLEFVIPKAKEIEIDFSKLSEPEAKALIDQIISRLKEQS